MGSRPCGMGGALRRSNVERPQLRATSRSVPLEWVIRTFFPRERALPSRAPFWANSLGSMRHPCSTLSSHCAWSRPQV